MTSFTGRSPGATYKDILQISNGNSGITTTPMRVSDGEGTDSPLYIGTTGIGVSGAPLGLASEVTIVAAASLPLATAASNYVRISGSAAIASFGLADAGVWRHIRAGSALSLTYGATSIITPSAAPLLLSTGDVINARSLASDGWIIEGLLRNADTHFARNQQFQSFTLQLIHSGGVIKHAIFTDPVNAAASRFAHKITGASETVAATPVGADGSEGFLSGARRSSANNHRIIFDTATQTIADFVGPSIVPVISFTGDNLVARLCFVNITVNGTARVRLCVDLFVQSSGAAFDINTTNILNGEQLFIPIQAFLV